MQFYAQKFTHVAWCNFAKGKGQNLRPPSLRLLTNSPRFFFSKQSRFVVSRWWYLIDIKLLNTAFVISKMNGQEYFDDRSRVCFTNFIPVRIIFNRIIFFFFFFILSPTNEPSQTYFSCEQIWNNDDDDTRVHILVKKSEKSREAQSELFEFDDKTIWRG